MSSIFPLAIYSISFWKLIVLRNWLRVSVIYITHWGHLHTHTHTEDTCLYRIGRGHTDVLRWSAICCPSTIHAPLPSKSWWGNVRVFGPWLPEPLCPAGTSRCGAGFGGTWQRNALWIWDRNLLFLLVCLVDRDGTRAPWADLGGFSQFRGGGTSRLAAHIGIDAAGAGPVAASAGNAAGAGFGRAGQAAVLQGGFGADVQPSIVLILWPIQAGLPPCVWLPTNGSRFGDFAQRGWATGYGGSTASDHGRGPESTWLLKAERASGCWSSNARGGLFSLISTALSCIRWRSL